MEPSTEDLTAYSHSTIERMNDVGVEFEAGLTQDEIDDLEHILASKIPPDLRQLLTTSLPISDGFPRWRDDPTGEAERARS